MSEAATQTPIYETQVHESLTVKYQPAPILKRTLAYIVDLGIVSTLMYALMLIAVVLIGSVGFVLRNTLQALSDQYGSAVFFGVVLLVLLVLGLSFDAYFIYFELKKGHTLGKKMFGLQVISLSHPRLTLNQVMVRSFLRYIDCFLIAPGLISMLLNDRKQRLGDLAASTMVIHSKRKESQENYLYLSMPEYERIKELLSHSQPSTAEVAEPLDRKICELYLSRAFPFFILGQTNLDLVREVQYLDLVMHHYPRLRVHSLDPEVCLRFFAQECFKFLNN